MSHLTLKKVDGKYKMFNKNTGKTEGKAMENYEKAKDTTEKKDKIEDKELEGHDLVKKSLSERLKEDKETKKS